MSDRTHPYISSNGAIAAAITHFRKSFPAVVNAETLKKLGIASNNESYLISILRYVGAIDEEGKKTTKAATVFSSHDDNDFQAGFEEMVKQAYAELFALHGDSAWTLPAGKLISFFRTTDKSSDIVGRRQAATFQALSSFAGHGEPPEPSKPSKSKDGRAEGLGSAVLPRTKRSPKAELASEKVHLNDVSLTVRVEVNLPPGADQETYDRIFRSIRENLLSAE